MWFMTRDFEPLVRPIELHALQMHVWVVSTHVNQFNVLINPIGTPIIAHWSTLSFFIHAFIEWRQQKYCSHPLNSASGSWPVHTCWIIALLGPTLNKRDQSPRQTIAWPLDKFPGSGSRLLTSYQPFINMLHRASLGYITAPELLFPLLPSDSLTSNVFANPLAFFV